MARAEKRPRFVPEREVYPYSRTHIARLRKAGKIPPAVKLNGPRSQNLVDTEASEATKVTEQTAA
jgi:hypothetical protein